MMRCLASAVCVLLLYMVILVPFTRATAEKPHALKLGSIPHPKVLQVLFPDFQELLAANILGRVILYYGTLTDEVDTFSVQLAPDYQSMSRAVHTALRLDPYNMDGYYFGQSILAWDVRQYKLATELLEYGMQYRTWDWQLPFFAAFNYAYFLKDRSAAAKLYMRAGELSGVTLFKSLAGRYLLETGETRMAIDYLKTLEKSVSKPAIKNAIQVRIASFEIVLAIEQAREFYIEKYGSPPASIDTLVGDGFLETRPVDPYGGEFYLNDDGQVVTTSKFTFAGGHRSAGDNSMLQPPDK